VRKPKRPPPEQLAPHVWELPARPRSMWGDDRGPAEPPQPIHWAELFGNSNPVEIEVGFGKGLFLVTSARARPETNFFGIEIVRKYQMYAAGRAARHGFRNVVTCSADAKRVLRDHVLAASVAAVHVFFPDPWWKNRHRKRLLFTPEFAELVSMVLRPGGRLHFVTDVADYFAWVQGTLAGRPELVLDAAPDECEPTHDMDYLTNFERKFRKEGRPIYRAQYVRAAQAIAHASA
jgi:tRNA (guanine-N7-)-methyltransferase